MNVEQQIGMAGIMLLFILMCAARWYRWRCDYLKLRELYISGVKIKQSRFFPVDHEYDYFYFPDEDQERIFQEAWHRLQAINRHKHLNVPVPSDKGYQLGDFAKD